MTRMIHLSVAAALAGAGTSLPARAAEVTPLVIPRPPPGKGQIVFFRSSSIMGAALGCSVNEHGQKVSSLGRGKYFIMVADPGRHEFTVQSEAKDVLALEVEADETQYASCKIKMGIMVGRPDIRPATENEFRSQKGLKLVDADDMGPGPGALRPEQIQAALAPARSPEPVAATAAESAGDATAAPGEEAPATDSATAAPGEEAPDTAAASEEVAS